MAKTFIGELILRFKDESAGGAKKSAADITASIGKIEAATKRMNEMPWGGKFTQQIEKLGASSKQIDRLRSSWDKLYADMQSKNLSKALQKSEMGNWKNATLQHFIQQQKAMRDELDKTEKKARGWRNNMNSMLKVGVATVGAGAGTYLGGLAARGGITASAEWEREKFRQQNANIPAPERETIIAGSEKLGSQYQSVSITDIAEMARGARAMMGSTERAMQIMPDVVKGYVALQTSKGPEAAISEMRMFLKGADNAGVNVNGPDGITGVSKLLEAWIRASQIEGNDLNMGDFLSMAKHGKTAIPGLSDRFLATSPAFVQDVGPSTFCVMLQQAFRAFVLGLKGAAGKAQVGAQQDLGIRTEGTDAEPIGHLIQKDLFTRDPYQWVKEVLIPQMEKQKIDTNDPGQVAQALSKLGNSSATDLLIRMVTQRQQIDRNIGMYDNAVGPQAATDAASKDPFVAYQGFIASLQNLAAALGEVAMPRAVAAMNGITSMINSLQQAFRDGSPLGKMAIAGGAAAGGFGIWKILSGVYALATAGPALTAAAASLEAAAISLGGGGVAGAATRGKGRGVGRWIGSMMEIGGLLGRSGPAAIVATLGAMQTSSAPPITPAQTKHITMQRYIDERNRRWRNEQRGPDPDINAQLAGQRAASGGANPLQAAVDHATSVGGEMKAALSITAKPIVDTSNLDGAIEKAERFNALMGVSASLARQAASNLSLPSSGGSVSRQMNRSFADIGTGFGNGD